MILLPAVDLLDGKAVRLARGKRDAVTVYSDDPVSVAKQWADAGAQWLHVVDLNGAFEGKYSNFDLARKIIKSCGIHVELSGGIRTDDALSDALQAGAARVVLGTKACEDPAFVEDAVKAYGEKIAVAIDATGGKVVSRGWDTQTELTPVELAVKVLQLGVQTLICTDVSRDGMMQGPNVLLLSEILDAGAKRVIASGGISSLEDLRKIKELESRGVIGAIVGKAIYEGAIDVKAALALLRD